MCGFFFWILCFVSLNSVSVFYANTILFNYNGFVIQFRSGSVMLPALFFFFKIALTIQRLQGFYTNFGIICSIFNIRKQSPRESKYLPMLYYKWVVLLECQSITFPLPTSLWLLHRHNLNGIIIMCLPKQNNFDPEQSSFSVYTYGSYFQFHYNSINEQKVSS